jgi:hypothetical protein
MMRKQNLDGRKLRSYGAEEDILGFPSSINIPSLTGLSEPGADVRRI